jgi:aspirochlorine biosynthesis cytochrome P450 monooxygenase
MSLAIQYAMSTVQVADKMMSYHWLQRPFISWFLSDIPQLRSQFKKASAILKPFLTQRLEQCLDPSFEKPDDLMQWLIDTVPDRRSDIDFHTGIQMEAVQAATFNLTFQVY